MGRPRSELQTLLRILLGSNNVYFQPPANVQMKYPCIVYGRDFASVRHAANVPYIHTKRYQVTVITQDPDSDIPDKIAALPMSSFQRFYAVDNLNHDVFDLFF